MISQIYCTGKSSNEGKTQSYNILDSLSSLQLGACGLQLFSFFNFFGPVNFGSVLEHLDLGSSATYQVNIFTYVVYLTQILVAQLLFATTHAVQLARIWLKCGHLFGVIKSPIGNF